MTAPRVKVQLLDAGTNASLLSETIDGIKTFQGSSGKEFYISVEVERRMDDQRVFTVMAKLDGEYICYAFHCEHMKKQTCIFDGFPINNGAGRAMFKFNDMMVGNSNASDDSIGTICIYVHERGEIHSGTVSTEANMKPREGTEKQHAKFFENQRLSTVGGSVVENKYAGGLSTAYECGKLLCSTTVRYDDSTHVTLRAAEKKRKRATQSCP